MSPRLGCGHLELRGFLFFFQAISSPLSTSLTGVPSQCYFGSFVASDSALEQMC